MGTAYHVTIVAPTGASRALRAELEAGIERQLRRLERAMSSYMPDSELSRFNRAAAGTWQPVSSATVAVVALAQDVAELSGGAFDITVGGLVDLWGFGAIPAASPWRPPSTLSLQTAHAATGYRRLQWRATPPALRKLAPLQLDLSAVAKGYAVDRVADYLRSHGLSRYLVELGGELRAQGQGPTGRAWRLGIERPDSAPGTVQRVLHIDGAAVATSGDYRNYRRWRGQRYSHSMDPRRGRPVRHALASVTVVARRAARADALATALHVLGPEPGRQLAERHGLAAFFIIRSATGDWEDYATPAMAAFLPPR